MSTIYYTVFNTPKFGRGMVLDSEVIDATKDEKTLADDVYKALRTLFPDNQEYEFVITSDTEVYMDII